MALDREEQSEERRYGYRVGSMGFLIPPHAGSEAIAMPAIAPIPNSAPWLRGMLNLRGALVPVFDLALVLGLSGQARREQSAVLVFGKGAQAVGVVTDGYPGQLPGLARMAQLPELPTALRGHVSAGYTQHGAVWLELDFQALMLNLASV
jgi:twitching motility protein PilI